MSKVMSQSEEELAAQAESRQRSKNRAEQSKAEYAAGRKAMKRLAKPIRPSIIIGQIVTTISAVLSIAPYLALVELGHLLIAGNAAGKLDEQRIWTVLIFLVCAFATKLSLYFAGLMITHFADVRLRDIVRKQIAARLAQAPLAWFTQSTSGTIRKAVQDDTITVHTVIAHGPVERLNALVSPLALLAYAFIIDPRLGLLSIATIPIYLLVYLYTMRGMSEKTAEMDGLLERISATMVEFVSGIAVIKAFGQVGRAHENYLQASKDFSVFYRAWSMPLVNISSLAQTWISAPILLVVNFSGGALLVAGGYVAIPDVIATTLIALVLPGAIMTLATITWSYQLAGAAAVRLCDILDTPILQNVEKGKKPANSEVKITNVSFNYGQTQALKNVSLELKAKTVTALLGPSGSGKSTLATLIARFADPGSGSISIGGIDLRELDQETLYSQVSFVLQDAQLLAISVRDNIALGRPKASLEEIRAAARAAQIDDFIMQLPHAYDTIIGEETALSGGQAQRVAIARAVLLDTPILILDEATAFADPESETEIQRALNELVKEKTVLVIAHRPGSIRGAHQIVILENGSISAKGTYEDLKNNEHYRALIKQSGHIDTSQIAPYPPGTGQTETNKTADVEEGR